MKYKTLKLKKSKTIGVLDSFGRTKFKKIELGVSADLDDTDNKEESYAQLSAYIDKMIDSENK